MGIININYFTFLKDNIYAALRYIQQLFLWLNHLNPSIKVFFSASVVFFTSVIFLEPYLKSNIVAKVSNQFDKKVDLDAYISISQSVDIISIRNRLFLLLFISSAVFIPINLTINNAISVTSLLVTGSNNQLILNHLHRYLNTILS